MKILGVIAEYNPFHNGHMYHLQKSGKITGAEHSIAVMSGNFVQRGEPAVLNKYLRTKMCLLAGVDIVIELPVFFATASAEIFASAAVKILDSSGIVDSLCFGSESGNLEELEAFIKIVSAEGGDFVNELRRRLGSGDSYPKARAKAAELLMEPGSDYMNNPNNILGVEYLRALKKFNSKIKPFTFKRETADYHSEQLTGEISSASAIRKAVAEKNLNALRDTMPEFCFNMLEEGFDRGELYTDFNVLSHIFQYVVKGMDAERLRSFSDVSEGLENRILKCAGRNFYLEDVLTDLKTKRYTLARLRRILLHIILDMRPGGLELSDGPGYIRVLGFRKGKSFLVSELKKKSSLPVITNLKTAGDILDERGMAMLQKEIYSTDVYYLSQENYMRAKFPAHIEYKYPMIMV